MLVWAALGMIVGASGWLLGPRPQPMRPPLMLLVSVAGALLGGFVSWIFWDFPSNPSTFDEFITVQAHISDCLAAFGSLVALSLATGITTNDGSYRSNA
jgi:hypothetical protein